MSSGNEMTGRSHDDNPYQSSDDPTAEKSTRSAIGVWEYLCFAVVAALAVAAVSHYHMIHDLNAYRSSQWIRVEFIALLLSAVTVPISLMRAVFFASCAQYSRAFVGFITCVSVALIAMWAAWYDAPTIMYAT